MKKITRTEEQDTQGRDALNQDAAKLAQAGDIYAAENLRGLADVWTTPKKKRG